MRGGGEGEEEWASGPGILCLRVLVQFWAVTGQRGSRGAGAEPGTNFASSEPWGREGARLWWVCECRRWQREVADVGHLFYKFGSKEGRKEVAQAAGSRKRLLGFSFCKWQDGDFFPPRLMDA